MSGYAQAEVLGQLPQLLRAPGEDKARYEEIWEVASKGQPWQGELPIQCQNGAMLWHKVQVSPVLNDQGHITQYLVILEDVTERRRIEAEQRIAATAFETQEGMMVADSQGVILKINQAFTEITGYSSQDVVGQTPQFL